MKIKMSRNAAWMKTLFRRTREYSGGGDQQAFQ
jgi:hypothetical protein